jgi:hypothetical protein
VNEQPVGLNPPVDLEKVVFTIGGKYYCLVEVPKPDPVLPWWWTERPASSGEACEVHSK